MLVDYNKIEVHKIKSKLQQDFYDHSIMERTKKEKKDFINEIIDSLNLIFVIHSMIILNTIIL